MILRQAMDFTVDGDVRFLAHSDMLRLFARATSRAGLPVHHSLGFNPHPQISLPLPRSVAMASTAERVIIGLDEPIAPQEALARLAAEMPAGIRITRAWELRPTDTCLPVRAAYRIGLATDAAPDVAVLSERVSALLQSAACRVQRRSPKHPGGKSLDIRPYVERLEVVAGNEKWPIELDMLLRITPAGSAKPAEICQALEINLSAVRHFIRRVEVEWQ
ncbi:MAG TPA: TIGR03936 family radical SAM-associated protein [Phycisphaerae bacterium]